MSEKKLRARIEELEVELDQIKNETFTAEDSAFKGLSSGAVRWKFDHGRTLRSRGSFSLICKNCGASLGPQATKTPGGKIR